MSGRQGGLTLYKLRILLGFLRPTRSPKWGAVFITKHCNLACRYCKVATRNPTSDLPTEEWKRIIERLSAWGVRAATIVGGEPTTRADLPLLVSHMRRHGILPCLLSNFVTADRDMIDTLANHGLFSLQASIDGQDGKGRRDLSSLALLEHAQNVGILPLVSMVVSSDNVEEVSTVAKEVTSRGIVFNCSLYQEVGGAFSAIVPGLKPPIRKLLPALRDLERIKRHTGLVRTTYAYLHNVERLYLTGLWHCNPFRDSWVNVNADGTLMPCQEYESSVRVLDVESLSDPAWRQVKQRTTRACRGCYYQCYFEQETSPWSLAFRETKPIMKAFTGFRLSSSAILGLEV